MCGTSRALRKFFAERFQLDPIYPQIRAGANQTLVNFFLVPVAEDRKLLIELVESPKKPKKINRH